MLRAQLKSRLNNPYRIRRGASHDSGARSGAEVHVAVLATVVEGVGDDLLPIAVREKVDRTSGNDANESGTETFKERTR